MGYNLVINGVYWGYNPLTHHLLTSWDIQVDGEVEDEGTPTELIITPARLGILLSFPTSMLGIRPGKEAAAPRLR